MLGSMLVPVLASMLVPVLGSMLTVTRGISTAHGSAAIIKSSCAFRDELRKGFNYTKGIFSEGDRFPLFALQRSSTRRLGGPGAPRSVASEAQHGSTGLLSLTAKLSVPMADEKMVQLLREVGLDASVEEKFKQVCVG